MALHTKVQVARLCGVKNSYIKQYIGRGKITLDKKGFIDDTRPENALFIKSRVQNFQTPITTEQSEEINPVNVLIDLKERKTEAEIKKIDLDAEKISIQIRKLKGEVIPSDVIRPLILQHNQSILSESKNMIAEMLRYWATENDIPTVRRVEMTAAYIDSVNDMIKKATALTVKSINTLIKEYAAKRGIGERA